jgi:hypothetical protein
LAQKPGCRTLGEATIVPRRTVVVAQASPVSQGIAACQG